jgi:hypothetical protein
MGFSCGDMGPLEAILQGRTNPAKNECHHPDRTALPHTAASQQSCVHLAVTTQCQTPGDVQVNSSPPAHSARPDPYG